MLRHCFAVLASLAASLAYGDCGDVTKGLLGIEIGGPRAYLTSLPEGLELFPYKQEWLTGGVDTISGKTAQFDILQAKVSWHENRVALVLVTIQGTTTAEIDSAQAAILKRAGVDFLPDTIPAKTYLRCGDGLRAQLTRSQIVRSRESVIPLLIAIVENSALKSALLQASRPSAQQEKDLQSAAEGGDVRAQFLLAQWLKSKNDRTQATQWLRRAAEAGYADAQHELGVLLGLLAEPDSWNWFEKAASGGREHTLAYVRGLMFNLICDRIHGRRYFDFLQTVVANSGAHQKAHKAAQTDLRRVVHMRERGAGHCG